MGKAKKGLQRLKRSVFDASHRSLLRVSPTFRTIESSPIFIVGCGHSGTTLLLRILGAHPNILAVATEAYTFHKQTYRDLKKFDFRALAARKRRWAEKTPIHVYHIRDIFRERPNASILLVIRDGRDVALSLKRRTGSFEEGVRRWVADNKEGDKWWKHPQVKVVRYEDIVSDFDSAISDALSFLGEEFSEEVRMFHNKAGSRTGRLERPEDESGKDYRMWQVSQPLFDGRAQWVDNLSNEEEALFKQLAGEMLIRYGYAKDESW